MAIPVDDVRHPAPIPAQRTISAAPPAVLEPATGEVVAGAVRLVRAPAPTTADVVVGTVTWALSAVRSASEVGVLAGQVALDRLPIPGFLRNRARRLWRAAGSAGLRERAQARRQLEALLDVAVPEVVRTLLPRVDLDEVADRLDVDRVVDRVDLDRIVDRIDLDELASRIDLDRILDRVDLDGLVSRVDVDRVVEKVDLDRVIDRVDLDRAVARVDLDGVIDRVDLDRAVARVDLDPVLERADIVGLARYVIDAIDLPELIRSSTGSMTSDMVRGVRAQGADADEAVQRVVDRLLRRHGRRGDPSSDGAR